MIKSQLYQYDHSQNDENGMIVLSYQINNKINTNYAYVASVENGIITSITKNFAEKPSINEKDIVERASKYTYSISDKAEYVKVLNIQEDDIVSESEQYFYDYRTNKLTFIKTLDYVATMYDDVIVDNVYTIEL